MLQIQDITIQETSPLVAPSVLLENWPITEKIADTVGSSRKAIGNILQQIDHRLLVIVGPCSIHDEQVALDYGHRLAKLKAELNDKIFIVMRSYLEKPRSVIGWKGFISDPDLDGSLDMESGLKRGRKLLLKLSDLGLPLATEFLDPIVPQYISDLISWAAIGARTTESQTHREMSSGLSMPVGYKNATDGNIKSSIEAVKASAHPHSFLGIDRSGRSCIIHTSGNQFGHVVLRGGVQGPNYDAVYLRQTANSLAAAGLPQRIIVDCSHDNSGKIANNQELVCKSVISQLHQGYDMLAGIMLESNIHDGKQQLPPDVSDLKYGVSITDECIGWSKTEELLRWVYTKL